MLFMALFVAVAIFAVATTAVAVKIGEGRR
jgi:hypothetical protein